MKLRFASIGVALTVVVLLSLFFLNLHTSYGASISDNKLKVQTIAKGLSSPTSMTFIDNKNIVVLEKNTGKARLISNGVLKLNSILTVFVNTDSERGQIILENEHTIVTSA